MTSTPTVSIVVPIYNASNALHGTLLSLRQQTYAALQIVLVDDGSTDGSGATADKFAADNPKLNTIVLHTENNGAYAARETGIARTTGDYVGFCDAGDHLHSQAIQKMAERASATGADIVIAAFNRVGREARHTEMTSFGNATLEVDSSSGFLTSVNTSLWNKLFARRLIEGRCFFGNPPRIGEDAIMLFSLYPRAKKISFIDEPLYEYIVSGSSAMNHMEPRELEDMIASWFETRKQAEQARPGFSAIVDVAAAVHLGVSAPLAVSKSAQVTSADVARCARRAREALDASFPTYCESPFLRRQYVRQFPSMSKMRLMCSLVAHGLVPAALWGLRLTQPLLDDKLGW